MLKGRTVATVRLIRVFVSSPGDVQEERKVVDDIVRRINRTQGDEYGVRLETWKWEENVVPQIGPNAQGVVDAQMPTYDIYLGIMGHRFGSPTGRYGSGTEKKFKDALRQWGRVGTPWILFYFNESAVNPATLNLEQYAKVRKFRDQVQKKGLYAKYEDLRDGSSPFSEQVDDHLRKSIPLLVKPAKPDAAEPGKPTLRPKPSIPQAYLNWLCSDCADVDLLGMQVKEGRSLKLDNVYVPLTTQAREMTAEHLEEESREQRENRSYCWTCSTSSPCTYRATRAPANRLSVAG